MPYIYRADIYCDGCGREICRNVPSEDVRHWGDSNDFPQPCPAGEADTPQHCGACGGFLQNPLTPDGYDYVREAILTYNETGHGRFDILEQWAQRYELVHLLELHC